MEPAQHYRHLLHELMDMGMAIARQVHSEATTPPSLDAEPAPKPPADPTVAFDRIARTIRRTITLARHLDDPVPPRTVGPMREQGRRRILRDVEDAIGRRAAGTGEAERLQAELLERLDGPELDDELDHRPVADIIADICRDLGLEGQPGWQPWKRRTPADVQALCARAARVGSGEAGGTVERGFRLAAVAGAPSG